MEVLVTNVFERNYESTKRIVVNRGGTRSSKTYSLSQLTAKWLITGSLRECDKIYTTGVLSIVRETFPALKATVLRDFEEVLTTLGYFNAVDINKTERTYKYKGRTVEFFSLDDQQKVRGRKRDILWINEGNELDYDDFRQLNFRTSDVIFIDFNPSDPNTWINTEIEQKRFHTEGDVEIIVSTYRDNKFLDPNLVKEVEILQHTDSDFWKIFGEGDYAQIQGLVFKNWDICKELPTDLKNFGYALDFGFSNDETAMIEAGVQNGEIWVNELIYETGLTNPDISQRINDLSLKKNVVIVADSSEPKSIQELKNLKQYVEGAVKGQDSVRHSINLLKQYKINVTANSVNLIKELKSYKWKQKDGQNLNEPVDKFNHLLDALRYYSVRNLSKEQSKTPTYSQQPQAQNFGYF
jgi:phage terminase large subunit